MPKKSNKKRSDGRIAVSVYIGMIDGKRKYKTVYGATQKEAEKKAGELRAKLGKGLALAVRADTLSSWGNFYLNAKSAEVGEAQLRLISRRLDYWIDALGNSNITAIRPVDIQPVLNRLAQYNPYTGKPTARRTLSYYVQCLSAVFDYAIDNHLIDYNPAARVRIPQDSPTSYRRSLTPEERKRIIEFEHRGKPAMMLLMLSGLRRGEATALLWSDIDFENDTISVTKSYDFKAGCLKPPKNGKPRIVSVPKLLTSYLSGIERKSVFVIISAHGEMMTESAWKRLLDSYLCDLNLQYGTFVKSQKKFAPEKAPMSIEPFTFHCLRHTFCTIMYEAGIDVLVAQQQMGHSDPKTTLAIYTHLQQEHCRRDLKKLDDYLSPEQTDARHGT